MPQLLRLRSDKDSHFSNALNSNIMETEDLTGLQDSNIIIRRIAVQSDQLLTWGVLLWATDSADDADLDNDTFLGFVKFAQADAIREGGSGQYYYPHIDLFIPYTDADSSKELHVSLINLSGTAKTATTGGEVVLDFTYQIAHENN